MFKDLVLRKTEGCVNHYVGGIRVGTAVDIHPKAIIGRNVVIGDHAEIGNHCQIAYGTKIENGVTIRDSVHIGPKSVIRRGSTIGRVSSIDSGAQIGEHVDIGPYVLLGQKVVIGNYCVLEDNCKMMDGAVFGNNIRGRAGRVYGGKHSVQPFDYQPHGGDWIVYVSDVDKRVVAIGCEIHGYEWWMYGGAAEVRMKHNVPASAKIYDRALKVVGQEMGWL